MTVKIQGMSCGHCVTSVENALKPIAGIKGLKVELGKATFAITQKIDQAKIKQAVEDSGFEFIGIEKSEFDEIN